MDGSIESGAAKRLSIVLLVHDRPELAAESLRSVQEISDELILFDGLDHSEGLEALAARDGLRYVRHGQIDDFAAAKNAALAECSGDWVLWIESGERLDEASSGPLRKFIDCDAESQRVYMLTVVLPSPDPEVSAEQVVRPRLIPRTASIRYERRICERPVATDGATALGIDTAPGQLIRDVSFREMEHRQRRARRDLELCEAELAVPSAPQPEVLIAKGEAHSELGQYEAAREVFKQAIEAAPHGSTSMLEAYYGLLTTFDDDAARHDEQIGLCLEALEIYPLDAQLLCAMGSYLQRREQLGLARRAFQTAVRYGQVDMETWHLTEIAEVSSVCYALTLQLEGQEDQARHELREAADRHPASLRVWKALLDLSIKLGDEEEAAGLVQPPFVDDEQQEHVADAVRGACRAVAGDWTAALGLLQSAYAAGCQHPICLRWLTITLMTHGQVEGLGPVLKLWLQQEPENAEAKAYVQALQQAARASSGEAVADAEQRSVRIDPAGGIADLTAPPQMPIIGQISTYDPSTPGEAGV